MPNPEYIPKIILVSPHKIIPHHEVINIRLGLVLDYRNQVYVPPIPLVPAPEDLKHLGDYVNYNGHHRTAAAKSAGINPNCIILENLNDLRYLRDNPPNYQGEIYYEFQENLPNNFESHLFFVWEMARKYANQRAKFEELRVRALIKKAERMLQL